MKPIQPHKDPRITNISFDNFTGSICIITPISDDEETKDLMLSSSQTNGDNDRFKSQHHHLSLITQPILAGRARRKDKIDSITNSRRSSYNDSPSLILPTNRTERISYEKKLNPQESSDSGVDFSLSTNSSVQYPQQQQHTNIHRPLSALNEDSNTDDGFHEQPIQYPIINIKDYDSMGNTIDKHHSNEQEKLNTIRETNLSRMNFLHPPPTSSIQQYHSLNDLTNNTKQNKSSRKKAKLNIIIEPSLPSSHLNINDEQIFPINRIPSSTSSINQTKIQQQQIKPKSITPLGCYPNQEQIRAHINRSVIERQHPSYLPMPQQKDQRQLNIPSKTNNILFQKPKLQNLHKISYRQTKQILPDLYHEEILDDHHEKRRLNKINKCQENSQKEQIRSRTIKDIQQPLKTNLKHEIHQDNFLTSTPRRHYEHGQSINTNFKRQQQQQPINPSYKSKLIGLPIQNKTSSYNRTINPKSEYSPRNTIVSFQTHHPKKLLNNHIEQIHPLNFRHKSHAESMNNLLETTHIQPMNINNSRRENPSKLNKTNKFFQTRSPTSGSLISEHHESSSSSPPHNELNQTYRLIPTDEQQQQQLIDGRYVIPANTYSQIPMLVDCASQTSSRHTQPFTCTNDSKTNNEINIDNPSNELTPPPDNMENSIDDRSCSSSSLDRFSPHDRFPLPLGKVTIAMDKDDLSTNYDSDDGWSDESADVIYVDERYITPKKKNISSSSILQFISQQHSHHHIQQ